MNKAKVNGLSSEKVTALREALGTLIDMNDLLDPGEDANQVRDTNLIIEFMREALSAYIPEPNPGRKNWEVECSDCGETPTVGDTGLCGPCCFVKEATRGGNRYT